MRGPTRTTSKWGRSFWTWPRGPRIYSERSPAVRKGDSCEFTIELLRKDGKLQVRLAQAFALLEDTNRQVRESGLPPTGTDGLHPSWLPGLVSQSAVVRDSAVLGDWPRGVVRTPGATADQVGSCPPGAAAGSSSCGCCRHGLWNSP